MFQVLAEADEKQGDGETVTALQLDLSKDQVAKDYLDVDSIVELSTVKVPPYREYSLAIKESREEVLRCVESLRDATVPPRKKIQALERKIKILEEVASLDGLETRVVNEARDFLDRYLDLRRLFIAEELTGKYLARQQWIFEILCFLGLVVDQLKYSTNYVNNLILSLKDEKWELNLPERKPGILRDLVFFDPVFRSAIRRWSTRTSRRGQIFANTAFIGWKRCWRPVRFEKFFAAVQKQQKCLTKTPAPLTPEQISVLDRLIWLLRPEVDRQMDEILSVNSKVSLKATEEIPCSLKGNGGLISGLRVLDQAWFLTPCGRKNMDWFFNISVKLEPWEFRGFVEERTTTTAFGRLIGVERTLIQVFSPPTNRELISAYFFPRGYAVTQKTQYSGYSKLATTLETVWDGESRLTQNSVTPAGIEEPGKIRMISKPAAGDYLQLGGLQKALWKALHCSKLRGSCVLTGSPISERLISEFNFRYQDFADLTGRDFSNWVSGDYSAATDNLNGNVSRYLLEGLLQNVALRDPLLFKAAIETMCEATVTWGLPCLLPSTPLQD